MAPAAPDEGHLTFINVFDIAEEEIDTFIAKWEDRSRHTTTAEGFISAELYRAIDSGTRFRVINVSKWRSLEHFEQATHAPQFRAELDAYEATSTWTPYRGFYRTAARLGE